MGKEVRSLKSYDLQLEAVKRNKAFVVQIFSNEDQLIGMLVIFFDKYSAYDGSVAVCPEYKKFYISHILKYYAILEINKKEISNIMNWEKQLLVPLTILYQMRKIIRFPF